MSFLKNEEQKGKTGLIPGLVPVGGGGGKERVKRGEYGESIMYLCTKME
jgi:hypothetical protein